MTGIAAICGFAVANHLPWNVRLGVPCLVLAIAFSFARDLFPRPPAREHVANDPWLQTLADLVILGPVATLFYFAAIGLLTRSLLLAVSMTPGVIVVYLAFRFASRERN